MEKQQLTIIHETAAELLNKLGVTAPFTITETEEGIELAIETEENGMLIGYHGETLEGLQLILGLIVAKKLGNFVRISIEIGEYKKKRMEYLESLIAQTKERVIATSEPVALPNLKAWERRYVHTLLKDDDEVISQSEGEGRERTLSILPR